MAEVDVKKPVPIAEEAPMQATQRREGIVPRRRPFDPFPFALLPQEYFGLGPFAILRRMQEEMDRDVREFLTPIDRIVPEMTAWTPAIEVFEQNKQLVVRVELPGLKPGDVTVEATEEALVIRGEKKTEVVDGKEDLYRTERRFGAFYRAIPLPRIAVPDATKAIFRNGLLEVTVPLVADLAKPWQVPIETAEATE
jgi:HSP20 family protein